MLGDVINVAVALVLAFGVVSFVTSNIVEAISSLWKLRAKTLATGISNLVNDPGFSGIAKDLFNHPLIQPQGDGKWKPETQNETQKKKLKFPNFPPAFVLTNKPVGGLPSYADSVDFANALLDVIAAPDKVTSTKIGAEIDKISNPELKTFIKGMWNRCNNDIGNLRDELANWFDSAMDRLSGEFKRYTQLISFVVALVLALVFHIDALHIAHEVWIHPNVTITANITDVKSPPSECTDLKASVECANKIIAPLSKLKDNNIPIGWNTPIPPLNSLGAIWGAIWAAICTIFGTLIIAFASLFGASFWFDFLGSLTQLRGTGQVPEKNKT